MAALGVGGALGVALEQMLLLAHSRHAAVDALRAAENQLLREEVEQLRRSARRGALVGASSSSPLARSAGAKERRGARGAGAAAPRRAASALDQSLKGFSPPGRGRALQAMP